MQTSVSISCIKYTYITNVTNHYAYFLYFCITEEKEVEKIDDLILSWDEFAKDTSILADKLKSYNKIWKGLIAITRGGLVPATILANKLGIRLVDTICISSYDNRNQRSMNILKKPSVIDDGGDGEGWLIIDDLVDSGNTIKYAGELYPKAHYAVVYAKPDGKSIIDTYVRDINQSTWIEFPWEEKDE